MNDLPVDSDGEPCRYLNHYQCDDCNVAWEDEWSCMCNDHCPECDAEIEPFHSYDRLGEDG